MSDPKRIFSDPNATSLQKHLLEAWHQERPSDEARKRTLTALGVAAATATVLPKAAAASGLASSSKALVTAAWLKWTLAATAAIGCAGGAVLFTRAISEAPATTAQAPSIATSPNLTTQAPLPTPAAATQAQEAVVPETPSVSANALPPARTGRRAHPSLKDDAHEDSLQAELRSLDLARSAALEGRPREAVSLVDDYLAHRPNGVLSDEAEVIRLRALAAMGDTARVHRDGRDFLAKHPHSPHAARVRALIDASP